MGKKKSLAAPAVPLELWRELYQASARFQAAAPWQWMVDSQVLGINNEHGVRLLCVLGNLGEVFGLASYRGTAGANSLLRLLGGETEPESDEAGFGQDSLLVDFVPRKSLRKEDLAILGQIGFEPPPVKPKRFPEFYSHRPGYVPWFVDEAEARCLLDDLHKALRFAELLRAAPDLYASRRDFEFPFFPASVTEPLTLEQFDWHIVVPAVQPGDPPVDPGAFDLPALLGLPQPAGEVWELTAFFSPMPIAEPPRPYWPKLGISVEANGGMILGFNLSGPAHTMAQAAARGLVNAIQASGKRPATIKVNFADFARALEPLARELKAGLVKTASLPMANQARQALEGFQGLA